MTAPFEPYEKKRRMSLPNRILLGLLLGAVAGVIANVTLGEEHAAVVLVNTWIAGPIGQIFLRMLFMIVVPLVFASITLGVAGLGDVRKVGAVGGRTLAWFLGTTLLAAALGILMVLMVRPGSDIPQEVVTGLQEQYAADASARIQASEQGNFGISTFVNIVPRNPVQSAVNLDLLGLIFFGIVFGAALTMIKKETALPMIDWLRALEQVVVKIVHMAMLIAPYGVAGLIFGLTSTFGWTLLASLGIYATTVLVALILHLLITISSIVRLVVGLSPITFFKRIRASIVTAFSTSSSAATLPTNIAVSTQNFGVPRHIAGFVLPLGATMCMNGTALFEGITVLFLCQVFGVVLSIPEMFIVVVMVVLTAVGAAGVPGGSIPLLVGILTMFGVPGEGIALVLGIDRILDMSRTAVNVIGDHCVTLIVAKSEGVWSLESIPREESIAAGALDESPGWPT
jgi:DAACS family dicarboxylate/amino acid:cation (Na+ or H+) symporter